MNIKIKLSSLASIAFVLAITAPMFVSLLMPDQNISASEKRTLKQWPIFSQADSIKSYFSSVNDYASDHFGFRESLIELNNKIKYALNESPVKSVIRGDGEWLFYKIHDPLMSNHVNTDETLKGNLQARANYIKRNYLELKQKNIVYQHIVVPNKMNLYPEYLPKLYALTDINATYDFFKTQLNDIDDTVAFDAIDALTPNKKNMKGFDLFFKNDTHWNVLGAYYVYQESFKRLQKKHPELQLNIKQHTFKSKIKIGGDLANYIGLGNALKAQEAVTDFPECTQRQNIELVRKGLSVAKCGRNDTTIFLVADSFMAGIYAYMAESVGTLYMTTQKTNKAELRNMIEEVNPDIVIEILIERSLARPLP